MIPNALLCIFNECGIKEFVFLKPAGWTELSVYFFHESCFHQVDQSASSVCVRNGTSFLSRFVPSRLAGSFGIDKGLWGTFPSHLPWSRDRLAGAAIQVRVRM